MDTARDISTSEMLLQVMEFASLGAATRTQISKHLRRAHPFARLDRRVANALTILEAEGLVELEDDAGELVFRTTHAGLNTLEQRGRYTADATVVFTDIVGSTTLIEDVGEAAAHGIRQRHFELLRTAVNSAGGREVKNLGDGLMIVFGKPAPAIACANDMQERVAVDDDQLGLRVGIHAGELLRDGNDYFGSTVIVARRLCDLAETGQSIVSAETHALLGSSTKERFDPLGPLTLKGLSAPVDAMSLLWAAPAESLTG